MTIRSHRSQDANIAGGLSKVSRDHVIEKNLAHFHAADPGYGRRSLRED
ncbi:hypothetical protein [Streptomyces tibetensis]